MFCIIGVRVKHYFLRGFFSVGSKLLYFSGLIEILFLLIFKGFGRGRQSNTGKDHNSGTS